MTVEVARDNRLYKQGFSRGVPTSKLLDMGAIKGRKGTTVTFHPDPEILENLSNFAPPDS
jgi:topoisomerase-4 subunit B